MLFPHVLSTETKSETTMGFSHNNSLKSESRASESSAAFGALGDDDGRVNDTIFTSTSEMPALQSTNEIRLYRRLFVWQLKRRWKQQRLQHHHSHNRSVPFKSRHHSNNPFVSTILCINQKAERSTSRNSMPSGQVCNIRWPNNELCFSAETVNRRPRSACNSVPSVAMARSTLCNRTETDTIMPKRNRSGLCLLQSNTLVPDMSNRYSSVFIFIFIFAFSSFYVTFFSVLFHLICTFSFF